MDSLSFGHGAVGRRLVRPLVLILGLALLFAVATPQGRAFAAGDPNAKGDAISPVEDFSRELDKLKRSFGELGKKMDDSAKAIEGYTDSCSSTLPSTSTVPSEEVAVVELSSRAVVSLKAGSSSRATTRAATSATVSVRSCALSTSCSSVEA
jgi:hypothetical protein